MTTSASTTTAPATAPLATTARTFVGILVPGPSARERVAGVAVARRAAIVLRRAGCQRIVARASDGEALRSIADDPRVGPLEASLGEGPSPGAGLSPGERVALVVGDVTFPVALVEELASRSSEDRGAFTANEAGLVLVGPATVARDLLASGASAPAAIASRAREVATEVGPGTLRPAGTTAERRAATRAILRATGKAVDGPLTRLFERRISQTISSVLLPLPVSPNVMTTVSCAIGLAGASLLATTGYGWRILGAALFVFATIVDGCDGEIARSKFLESSFGRLYDTAVDILVNAAVFVGIGIGTWRELEGVSEVRTATLLLVGGGVAAMAVVESVRRILAPAVVPGSVLGRAQGWLEWFATVEWCYLVLGLAIAGQIPFFFFGAAVGANAFALVYLTLGVVAWRRG